MLVVAAGVVLREGRMMICQRKAGVHNGLKWEFPGGKLETGESPEAALARELKEELEIEVRVGRICDAVFYRYPDRDVLILFYFCEILAGKPVAADCNAIGWVTADQLKAYDFSGADAAFCQRLAGRLLQG